MADPYWITGSTTETDFDVIGGASPYLYSNLPTTSLLYTQNKLGQRVTGFNKTVGMAQTYCWCKYGATFDTTAGTIRLISYPMFSTTIDSLAEQFTVVAGGGYSVGTQPPAGIVVKDSDSGSYGWVLESGYMNTVLFVSPGANVGVGEGISYSGLSTGSAKRSLDVSGLGVIGRVTAAVTTPWTLVSGVWSFTGLGR